jgi:flagellin-like protein
MKIEKGFIEKLQEARKGKGRKAVSPVIATLLLIAIAVAAGIVLYIFVSGLTTSLSNVKGTVTQPLQITVIKVTGTGGVDTITYQIVNPNGASIISLTDIITDNNGVQVTADSPALCTSVGAGTITTCAAGSSTSFTLQSGQTYRLVVVGSDAVGNQYSSNPAPFTAK